MSANLSGLTAATASKRSMLTTMIGSDAEAIERVVGDLFGLNDVERQRIANEQSDHNPF